MFEILSGLGLATSSGMNAYLPALSLGLLNRFTGLVDLPTGWSWIGNEWVLLVLGLLVVFELVADKIPGLDHINDIIQTAVRPASGGIVFGAGTSGETAPITDVASFFTTGSWVPVAIGVGVALVMHAAKVGTRAAANAVSGGTAAPLLSTAENGVSIGLIFAAVLAPLLVIVILGLMIGFIWFMFRAAKKFRASQAAKAGARAEQSPKQPGEGVFGRAVGAGGAVAGQAGKASRAGIARLKDQTARIRPMGSKQQQPEPSAQMSAMHSPVPPPVGPQSPAAPSAAPSAPSAADDWNKYF